MGGPARTDGSGLFCPNCGNSANPDHEYCIHCGHDLAALREVAETSERTSERATNSGRAATDRQRDDIEAFRRRIRFLVTNGWDIEYDGHDEVVLADRGIGSIWIHIVLLLFTAGIGNLFYAWYHYSINPTRVALRASGQDYEVLDPQNPKAGTSTETGQIRTSIGQFAGALVLLVLGFLMIVTTGLSFVPSLLGLTLGLVGLYMLPPARRRIRDRHAPTTFGPTETVKKRYVQHTDRPCAVCGSRVVDGVVRDYKQVYAVAGVPLYTMENGENYYCEDCQSVDTTYGTESSRGVNDEIDIDDEAFTDEIERELDRLRTSGPDDRTTTEDATAERTDREQDA
ncbi:zinc ribbon domain-containing protein [Halovenus sp. HT40]|uniref:zinc ribbon domain-containing protein n=1 Tax=Halovenus sp. HT40 TaxID=3126691 RepID=UPI00300EE865